ncbi:MAG: 3'(2'),5'-bisphosphate nucleotidase CysQ [Patescibacteria group bacterium]|nr:3'(2'),5'-bisphosphate nucleotidase CysQ [Patescibacteria group bacterium]
MIDIEQLISLVKKAGEAVLKFYDFPKVEYKEDNSPVTQADFASEKIILDSLSKISNFGILSEETTDDKKRLKQEYVWVVDPLDGTKDFIQKTGEFSIMVGLAKNGEPIMGVVYQPVCKKLCYAVKGKGSFIRADNGIDKQLRVSSINELQVSRLVVSRNHLSEKDAIYAEKMGLKNYVKAGSNGVKMCLIAQNKADLFFNTGTGMGEWDSCAPQIILTEAGGMVTGTDGRPLLYNKSEPKNKFGIVASNGILHKEILGVIIQ